MKKRILATVCLAATALSLFACAKKGGQTESKGESTAVKETTATGEDKKDSGEKAAIRYDSPRILGQPGDPQAFAPALFYEMRGTMIDEGYEVRFSGSTRSY